jgi:hypothetical protein
MCKILKNNQLASSYLDYTFYKQSFKGLVVKSDYLNESNPRKSSNAETFLASLALPGTIKKSFLNRYHFTARRARSLISSFRKALLRYLPFRISNLYEVLG